MCGGGLRGGLWLPGPCATQHGSGQPVLLEPVYTTADPDGGLWTSAQSILAWNSTVVQYGDGEWPQVAYILSSL